MSTFRIKKDKSNPYVMMNKHFLQDKTLSWKAKGLLSYLLSLPDDWQIYEIELLNHTTDKIDSTRSGIKELIENGYIERIRKRDDLGRLTVYDYSVHEVPIQIGFSKIGLPTIGKSTTTNNDCTDNDLTNILKNKKEKNKNVGYGLIIKEYSNNPLVQNTILNFIKMRKANKKVITDHALELLLNNLDKLATHDDVKIDILNQSILHCWSDIYQIKDDYAQNYGQKKKDSTFNDFPQREYDYDNLEKKLEFKGDDDL